VYDHVGITHRVSLVRNKVGFESNTVNVNHVELEHAELCGVPQLVAELSVTLDIVDLKQDVST
jgi:hypothetical protein